MDLTSRMNKMGWTIALCGALAAAMQNPVAAAMGLAAVTGIGYVLCGIFVRPMRSAWPTGARRRGSARRYCLCALCAAMMGAGALLSLRALLFLRFAVQFPVCTALAAALCARACASAVFARRTWRGSAALACTLTALAGLFLGL